MFDIQKNTIKTLRIERSEFRGHNLVNIPVWVEKQESGKDKPALVPTRKGVTVQWELLPEVIDALGSCWTAQKKLQIRSGQVHTDPLDRGQVSSERALYRDRWLAARARFY